MAGNPFRKSQFLSLDVSAAREAAGLETSQSQPEATSSTTKAKTKGKVQKKVRIQSPVISPDSPAAYRDQHDPFNSYLNPVGQPALPTTEEQDIDVARELRKSFIDSLARGATVPNREASEALAPPIAPPTATAPAQAPVPAPERMESSSQSGQQAPYNPFARTLATIEPQNAASAPVGLSRDTSAASAKPAMDVDAFTRMLLTGNTPSAASGPMASSAGHPSAAANSLGDLHPESPPASDDDEHHDGPPEPDYEQLTGLVRTSDTQPKKPKPPPPAHHHGKALSTPSKGPQTVSFADFDAATPPALPSPSIASPKPQLVRSPSDLNKPLPPPPPPHHSPSPDTTPSIPVQVDGPAQSPQLPAEDFSLNSKRAPPIPLSRRSSQMRSSSGRPRSSSNLSRSSVPDDHSDGTPTPPVKPPPPPARRGPHSVETDLPVPSARPPPPPPSRNTKQRPPSVSRTPSTNSVTSLNKANMPPPPPPRRGENKRRSLDGTLLSASIPSSRRMSDTSRRSSGASLHSTGGRTPSVSSIPTVDEGDSGEDRSLTATPQPQTHHVDENGSGSATTGSNDILADMNAMQAEIDALMARSKGGS